MSQRRFDDSDVDHFLGMLLRVGVLVAAGLVIFGGIYYLAGNGNGKPMYHVFRSEPAALRSVPASIRDAFRFDSLGVIQFGLLVLIATPIARVICSIFVFMIERDWIYVVVSAIVLSLLSYSLTH